MFSQSVRQNALSDASRLYSQMNAAATPNNVFAVKDRFTTPSSGFPVPLGSAQPDDLQMNVRQQVVNQQTGVVPGYGVAVADSQVFDYIERKKEAEIEADFRAWVMSQSDFSDPARAEFWNRVAPWITDLKIQEIEKNAELQKRLATVKVRGPTSEEDFKLLYFIKNGIIRMPSQPLHMMDADTTLYPNKDFTDGGFKRGLFNPLAYVPKPNGMAPESVQIPNRWGDSLPNSTGSNWHQVGTDNSRKTTRNLADFLTPTTGSPFSGTGQTTGVRTQS